MVNLLAFQSFMEVKDDEEPLEVDREEGSALGCSRGRAEGEDSLVP